MFPQAEKLYIQLMGIEAVSQDDFMVSFLWFEAFSIFSFIFLLCCSAKPHTTFTANFTWMLSFNYLFFKPGMCIVKTSMPRGMLLCSLHQAGALSLITAWNLIKKDAANLIKSTLTDQNRKTLSGSFRSVYILLTFQPFPECSNTLIHVLRIHMSQKQ